MSHSKPQDKPDSMRVLHVDDDPSILEITKQILQDMDSRIKIDFARSADEAFGKLSGQRYDAIVCDYDMPIKNGLDFLKELKQKGNSLPFILFTGKGREEVAIKALNLGADGYYNKQGDPETVYGELLYGMRNAVARKRAVHKLHETEHLTQRIVDSSPNLIYIYDLIEKRNVYANKEVTAFLGYTAEQVQAMGSALFSTILHPDDAETVAKHHARFADAPDSAVYELDYRMKHASGTWRWLRSHDTLFARTIDGKAKQILGTCEDITERKKAEETLKENEEKFRLYTEGSPIAIFVANAQGKYVYVNTSACEMLGYSKREFLSMSIADLQFTENVPSELAKLEELKSKGQFFGESILKAKDGTAVYVTIKAAKLSNGDLIASCENITSYKKALDVAKESREKLQILADESPNMIFINKNGRVVYTNNKCQELMGYSREEFLAPDFNFLTLIAPESKDLVKEVFKKHLRGEEVAPYEYRLVTKNGHTIDVQINAKLIDYEGGRAILGIITDITDRKKAADELEQKYEALERVAESLDSGLAIIGKDYQIIWANSVLRALVPNLEKKCYKTFNNLDHVCPECGVKKVFAGASSDVRQYATMNSKGEPVWVELRVTPLKDKHGNVTSAIELAIPITESKAAEEALIQSKQRLNDILVSIDDSVFALDNDWNFIYVSNKTAKDLQHPVAELVGKNFWQAFPEFCGTAMETNLREAMTNREIRRFEWKTIFSPGYREFTVFPSVEGVTIYGKDIAERKRSEEKMSIFLECAHTVMKTDEFDVSIREIVDSAKRLIGATAGYVVLLSENESENKVLFLDSGGLSCTVDPALPMPVRGLREVAYRTKNVAYENDFLNSYWVKFVPKGHVALKNVLFAPLIVDGKAVGLIGLANKSAAFTEDDAELARGFGDYASIALSNSWKLAAIKNQNAKLEALNEKLGVVGSLTRHDVRNKLTVAKSNVFLLRKRLRDNPELIKYLDAIDESFNQSTKIFEFSRVYEQIGAEKPGAMKVADLFDEASKLIPHEGVEVVNKTQGLTVIADSLLRQLFYNLIDNSLKHGKTLNTIELSYTQHNGETKLTYQDNGVGIPQENKAKIFSEGFTTGGSGLGLKLVKKMIEAYGWTITEEGEPGKGAKFVITIPAA